MTYADALLLVGTKWVRPHGGHAIDNVATEITVLYVKVTHNRVRVGYTSKRYNGRVYRMTLNSLEAVVNHWSPAQE